MRENGPFSPDLVKCGGARPGSGSTGSSSTATATTTATTACPAVRDKAILVPTAEEDPAIHLGIFKPFFHAPRGIVYLTPEEQALVEDASGNREVPSVVIGSGLNLPEAGPRPRLPGEARPRRGPSSSTSAASTGTRAPSTLFAYFRKFLEESGPDVDLVLAGKSVVPIPDHPRIRHVGFITRGGEGRGAAAVPAARDPLALREPLRDHPRGLEAGRAGARERALQGAHGAVPALERRALLPRLRGVRRGACASCSGARTSPRPSAGRAGTTSTASTPGRRSTRRWRSSSREPARPGSATGSLSAFRAPGRAAGAAARGAGVRTSVTRTASRRISSRPLAVEAEVDAQVGEALQQVLGHLQGGLPLDLLARPRRPGVTSSRKSLSTSRSLTAVGAFILLSAVMARSFSSSLPMSSEPRVRTGAHPQLVGVLLGELHAQRLHAARGRWARRRPARRAAGRGGRPPRAGGASAAAGAARGRARPAMPGAPSPRRSSPGSSRARGARSPSASRRRPTPWTAAASKCGRAARVEGLLQRLDGEDVAQVALVVLEDEGQPARVDAQLLEVLAQVRERLLVRLRGRRPGCRPRTRRRRRPSAPAAGWRCRRPGRARCRAAGGPSCRR